MIFGKKQLVDWATDESGLAIYFVNSQNISKAETGKAANDVKVIYNCFQSLLETDEASAEPNHGGIYLPAEDAVRLDDETRELFELPPKWPGSLLLESHSVPNLRDFSAKLRLVDPAGYRLDSWTLQGGILKVGNESFLPSAETYHCLRAYSDWKSKDSRTEIDHWTLIHALAESARAGCRVDYSSIGSVEVRQAKEVIIDAREQKDGSIVLTPVPIVAGLPELLGITPTPENEAELMGRYVKEVEDRLAQLGSDTTQDIFRIGRTIIHSDRRFTYEEAQDIIEGKKGDFENEILLLNSLAVQLRKKRFAEGSIDFNTEEVKFKLDEAGRPLGVIIKKMKDSNRLIEEFMLLANQAVGVFGGKSENQENPRTFVYRVHDKPDHQRLIQLRTFLMHLGYKLPNNAASNPSQFIRTLMDMLEGQPEADILRQMAIRSMAKAEYSSNNIGHFGLGFSHYTHFTSPIRRYPDMMAHRLLQHYLDKGNPPQSGDYEARCKQSSLMEKRAAEAERASIKYKQVEYMMEHIGEVFDGVVSGLTGWGIYVEIGETKSEGQVALRSITHDRFEFDADKYIIRGARTHEEIHLGDKVKIKVLAGDLNKRTLDFQLI